MTHTRVIGAEALSPLTTVTSDTNSTSISGIFTTRTRHLLFMVNAFSSAAAGGYRRCRSWRERRAGWCQFQRVVPAVTPGGAEIGLFTAGAGAVGDGDGSGGETVTWPFIGACLMSGMVLVSVRFVSGRRPDH